MRNYNLLVTKISEVLIIGMLCYTTISFIELLVVYG